MTSLEWDQLEQFYSERRFTYHRPSTPIKEAREMLQRLPARYANFRPLFEIIMTKFEKQ